jgi:hypothetical protein
MAFLFAKLFILHNSNRIIIFAIKISEYAN